MSETIIEAKLQELAEIPPGPLSGRRLELGGISQTERDRILREGLRDIANRLSPSLLEMMPAVALDQLIVMSVVKQQDTAGLLKSLLNSFLVAYISPETHDRAFNHLEGLEKLRAEVATTRKATQH